MRRVSYEQNIVERLRHLKISMYYGKSRATNETYIALIVQYIFVERNFRINEGFSATRKQYTF